MRIENEVDGSICHPSPEVKTPPLLSNDELRTIEQEKRKELTYRLMALPRPDCVLRIFERARMNISENGYTNVTDDMIEEAVTIVLKQNVRLKQSEDELLAKTLQKTRGIMKRNRKGSSAKPVTSIPASPPEIKIVEFSPELLK